MMTGGGKVGSAAAAVNGQQSVVNTNHTTGIQGRDEKEAQTAPKFGELIQQIQDKYGEKVEKPREIKKTLGKDDFLKIMLVQMKNQDPTNPFKAEQMAQEIAQFTSVEQLQNVNQNLNKMASQNRPLEQLAMTNLIGKRVTIDRDRFVHIEGQKDDLKFNLSKNAKTVQIRITDEVGEEVFQKDLGVQKAGEISFVWDGLKSTSLPAKGGTYRLDVIAQDDAGIKLPINSTTQGTVIGVSFEGSEPIFLVGDAKHQDKVSLKNIARIEEKGGEGR